ncbi:hypothetical protein AVEN_18533-1 [Araneus ventricosus]|uniref:Uncharacterized protein n=1 Tax=Araneus ventricosus TaxID=182803 RepID=A0A4Y2S7N1_ARAVE|nr:hypothetical protein AVEN_18533-1 [Araneus ventricosus]
MEAVEDERPITAPLAFGGKDQSYHGLVVKGLGRGRRVSGVADRSTGRTASHVNGPPAQLSGEESAHYEFEKAWRRSRLVFRPRTGQLVASGSEVEKCPS